MDIDTSVGGAKKGHVTDYKEIRGYVLARSPSMLHMIGLLPIVRTTAFDMVSDGRSSNYGFRRKTASSSVRNEVQAPIPDQPMENIRPQDIFDAHAHPACRSPIGEIAVLENGDEILHDAKGHRVLQEDYELIVIRKEKDKMARDRLARKIVFSRIDLLPHRQFIYDRQGNLVTDARYANYKDCDGTSTSPRVSKFPVRRKSTTSL